VKKKLASTWIGLVLDWANTYISGLLPIPLRRAPQNLCSFIITVQPFGHN
jgi:hypothetical protein